MPPVITDRNQETLELIAEAVHRIDHRTAQLAAEWARFKPIVEAFQRSGGGLLGMRAARKAGNGDRS